MSFGYSWRSDSPNIVSPSRKSEQMRTISAVISYRPLQTTFSYSASWVSAFRWLKKRRASVVISATSSVYVIWATPRQCPQPPWSNEVAGFMFSLSNVKMMEFLHVNWSLFLLKEKVNTVFSSSWNIDYQIIEALSDPPPTNSQKTTDNKLLLKFNWISSNVDVPRFF